MKRRAAIAAALAPLLAGCVTISVYFPAARVQSLTEQIEAEVQRKAQELPAPEQPPTPAPVAAPAEPEPEQAPAPARRRNPPRAELSLLDLAFGVRPAFAGESVPAPEVTSPAIRRLIDSRASRVAELNRVKSLGAVGEGNDALIALRALDAVADLAERAAVRRLVDAENADRRLLFEEIAAVEGVERSQLPRIQATYAQTLRRHARPGDWIQTPEGEWIRTAEDGR